MTPSRLLAAVVILGAVAAGFAIIPATIPVLCALIALLAIAVCI